MLYLQLFISIAFFCLCSSMTRLFQLKIWKRKPSIRLFQAGFCLTASVAYVLAGGRKVLSPLSVCLAVSFGLLFCLAVYMGAKCLDCGPMSITSVITNMSLSIPIVYSLVVFGERPEPIRYVGMLLMIFTIAFSALGKADSGKGKVSRVWVVCVLIAFFANGVTAVLQKQNAKLSGDGNTFLAIAYFVAFLSFTVIYLVENKGERFSWKESFDRGALVIPVTLLAGIGSFVGNGILGYLSIRIDASILYPCLNGGLALMVSLVSFAFFRERFTARKAVSMALGITAIVLLTV